MLQHCRSQQTLTTNETFAMNILPNFLTAPIAASALSGLLAFMPNPFLSQIGLAGSMGLGGYAVATAQTDPRKQRQEKGMSADRQVRQLKQELSDIQVRIRNLSRDKANLASELTQTQAARTGLVDKVKSLELALGDKASSPVLDICEYTQHLTKLNEAIAAKNAELAELATALEAANAGTESRVAAVKAETLLTGSTRLELEAQIERLTDDKQKLAAAYKSLHSALESAGIQYDAELSELGGLKEAQDEQALATIQHWKNQAANLAARIAELEADAKKPGRFGGLGAADVMGNKLIDFLNDNGVLMAAVESDPDPDKGLLVTLKPASHTSSIEVKNLMPRCESSLALHSLPTVSLGNGNYHFRLAVDPLKNTTETVKLTSNIKRLEKAVDVANHLFIFGSSGSGKSVFLDNAIWLGKCLWPDAKLDLCDPKYPYTKWSNLKPTTLGAEATVDAVIGMAKKMKERLNDASEAHQATGVIPDYPRQIFAIDEATVAYDEAKVLDMGERKGDKLAQNFGVSVASVLRLGRALGFKGYLLSQTMLVSKLGLNTGDYGNATCIFLNGMIDRALKGELKDLFEADDITAIEKELERRRTQNQSHIGLVADSNTGELFLFEAPRPGFYHDRFEAENTKSIFPAQEPLRTPAQISAKTANLGVPECAAVAGECTDTPPAQATHSPAQPSAQSSAQPRAKCPKCSEGSTELERAQPLSSGKFRFRCVNDGCKAKTFSAFPE